MSEQAYLNALSNIMQHGIDSDDRTGTGTSSLFGVKMVFDLRDSFPAVTTKKLAFKTMATELMWFVGGHDNIRLLQEHNCRIWDDWADKHGNLGPVYGKQWRRWRHCKGPDYGGCMEEDIDQLSELVESIKKNPHGRRHILSAWNVGDVPDMALPPCHLLSQFYVREGELSCMLIQRSGDMFLGVPFNFASYALLTHIITHLTGLKVGDLVHVIGDAHIYKNHFDQVMTQLSRKKKDPPKLVFGEAALSADSIDDFALRSETVISDFFKLEGYEHHPAIKAPIAV